MPGKYDKRLGMYRDKDGQSVFLGTNNVVDLYISNETEWLQAWEIFMNGEDAVRGWVNGNLILTDNREFFVDQATGLSKFFELRGIGARPITCGNFDLTVGRIYFENIFLTRTNQQPMLKVREGQFTADNLHFRYLNGIGRVSTPVPNIEIIGNYVSGTGSIKLKTISHASGDSHAANLSGDVQPFIILNNAAGAGLNGSNVYISIAEVQSISNFDVFSRVLLQSNQAVRYMVTGDETWYHDPAQLWPGAGNINATADILKTCSLDKVRVDYMPVMPDTVYVVGISEDNKLVKTPLAVNNANNLLRIGDLIDSNFTVSGNADNVYMRCLNPDPTTINVSLNATYPFPIGGSVTLEQSFTGQITIIPDVGVTITGNKKSAGQYNILVLVKTNIDSWNCIGGIE
jgi:hypothetical protein